MGQALVIRRTGEIDREQIVKMQETANRRALLTRRSRMILLVVFDLAVPLFVLLPPLYAASVAFMPSSELFTTEVNLVPKAPTSENSRQVLVEMPLVKSVFDSFLVAGPIILGQIIPCSLVVFSFSSLESEGKEILFMLVMATMMIPGEATTIPNYPTVSSSDRLDSYQVLVVSYLTSAMGIFLFRQFYKSFPVSLYESVRIDGYTDLRFILRTLLPLIKSAIGVMAVYTFINAWNMCIWSLLATGPDGMHTVQIGISMLNSEGTQSITLMIVGVVLVIIPSIAIFTAGQKRPIGGMFSGAAKG